MCKRILRNGVQLYRKPQAWHGTARWFHEVHRLALVLRACTSFHFRYMPLPCFILVEGYEFFKKGLRLI